MGIKRRSVIFELIVVMDLSYVVHILARIDLKCLICKQLGRSFDELLLVGFSFRQCETLVDFGFLCQFEFRE